MIRRVLPGLLALTAAGALATGLSALTGTSTPDATLQALGREWRAAAPDRLWGLMVLPWIWVVPDFGLSDLPRWQLAASTAARSTLVILVCAALAGVGVVRDEERVAAVVLVDVSDSMPPAFLKAAEAYIADVRAAGPGLPLEVVRFARRPERTPLPPPGASGYLSRLDNGGDATDLEAAIKMAYGLFPPGFHRRVVVLSDGQETEGDALAESTAARQADVRIDFVDLQVKRPAEVVVRAVHLPDAIEAEAPFTVRVEVFSTDPTEATATLWQDDYKQAGPRKVALKAGRNTLEFPATVHDAGFRRFRFELTPAAGADRSAANNSAQATAVVGGDPRVLIVEGEPRTATYLARALRRERIDVEVRGPQGTPTTLDELAAYDLFILSDVGAAHVSEAQMKIITRYVRTLGGGFLMAGGESSFGLGGYFNTPLQALLPVRFEVEKKREAPSLAIALLVDKSGSMTGDKIELAKDAAAATVELLSKDDQIAILAFDSTMQPLVRLQSARSRGRILSQLQRLAPGGGTNIHPALDEAYRQLRPAEARLKHVIVLSDGQSPPTGLMELAADMAADHITISTVAVGGEADRSLLNTLADLGGGRAYYTNDPFNIPRIFTKETQTVTRNALVERPLRARVAKPAQFLRGVRIDRAPYLLGYVTTKPKRGAEVILATEGGEPLFARWRQGLGVAAVWTSDVKNRWAVEWVRWRGWTRFWSQLARDMMRNTDTDGLELRTRLSDRRGYGRVILDAVDPEDRWRNGLRPIAEVTDPAGASLETPLRQTAAGRYEGEFPLGSHGAYLVEARPNPSAKRTATLRAGLAHPYPAEYLGVGTRRALLEGLASATGGRSDPAPDQVFASDGRTLRSTTELRSPLFLAALFLFLLDLLLRRIRLGVAGEAPFVRP